MAAKSVKNKSKDEKVDQEIPASLIDTVCQRLAVNQPVRRTLPEKGRLHIDRHLPFLCVYRQPDDNIDAGTEKLVQGEASYLIVSGGAGFEKSVSDLVHRVAKTMSAEFGAFLIVEIWSAPEGGKANDPAVPSVSPTFTIHASETAKMTRSIEALEKGMRRFKVLKQGVEVEVIRGGETHPPDTSPLLTEAQAKKLNCSTIGIAFPPVFRKPDSKIQFPMLVRSLRRGLSLALRQTYFEFANSQTTHRPAHYHTLGRKAVVKAVWDVDRKLAAVSNQFDYLLQLTPVNTLEAWKKFESGKFKKTPEFHYRPLPVDPSALKRELYAIRIDRVEDPAIHRIFEEKQAELELKITMLRDRDTSNFLYQSLQLFGGVEDDLLDLSKGILAELSGKDIAGKTSKVSATKFAELAEAEFAYYRDLSPEFKAKAEVSAKVSGLIVSRGKLLINSDLSLPPSRVRALLAHEVGTHLVTYYNGRMQPFQQLYSGFAGYEELQEGLAVLSEYLVDGLTKSRLRQLAARVVAVRQLTDGATFIETFRTLSEDYGFTNRTAYNITMRVYRGGGLTKDAIYLRGLRAILRYVQRGGDLNPLFVGKMAVNHIAIIQELQYRNVLRPVPVMPRYMRDDAAIARLERLQGGKDTILDLVTKTATKKRVKK